MNVGFKIAKFFLKKRDEKIPSKLEPLYPQSREKDHFVYVNELNRAVENKKIKNIALTGGYGSGKSSVLSGFESDKTKRVVRISFSTLGTNIQKYILDSNEHDDSGKSDHDRLNNLTNLIQKEVIKQLLFKEAYKNVPHSKYQRVAGPNELHTLFISGFIGFIFVVGLISTGWLSGLFVTLGVHDSGYRIALEVLIFIFLSASIAVLIFTLGSKLKLSKISGASISLSLSGENNYFDEYLDEIIYFFKATCYDVVIFEDIDRFDNLYIFENLRQLNAILNGSKQIGEKDITFIYAVKDSIFTKPVLDKNGGEPRAINDEELGEKNTNRTKFFDLIVPVVPFLTLTSSRDIILSTFSSYKLSKDVVGVVARYMTDMRLIKNIYNEFVIFKSKIIDDSDAPQLSLDKLFAIIVYKNRYLQDFEDAKSGKSLLDKVYNASRYFVNETRSSNSSKILEKKGQLKSIDSIASRASMYGAKLLEHMDAVARQNKLSIDLYTFASVTYVRDELMTEKFWKAISDNSEGTEELIVSATLNRPRTAHYMYFSIADIVNVIDGEVNIDQLNNEDVQRINGEIDMLERESKEVNYKNIRELMETYSEFRTKVSEIVGGTTMLYDLIESGYVDEDYTYYMSVYHSEKVSMKARNFLLQNIRFNIQDTSYEFKDANDIESMLAEVDLTYFNDKSMYNIAILDYLLPLKLDKRSIYIIKNLSRGGADEVKFIDSYIQEGKKLYEFTKQLSAYWNGIFKYIVALDIDAQVKLRLVSAAVIGSRGQIDYEITDEVSEYFSFNLQYLDAFTDKRLLKRVSDPYGLLKRLNVHIESIEELDDSVREVAIKSLAYRINKQNLEHILQSLDLSLSNMKKINPELYAYVVDNLNQYLNISGGFKVLNSKDNLEEIINDIAKQSPGSLEECLKRSKSICRVEDILKVSRKAWPHLFANMMVVGTEANIIIYYNELKSEDVDENLAMYLNNGNGIEQGSELSSEEKKDFALAVLRSGKVDSEVKPGLIHDLNLGMLLDVEDFFGQEGAFYGGLLRLNIIEDIVDNYHPLDELSWETKEAYIVNSQNFINYIGEVELSSEDIAGLMESERVSPEIKEYITLNAKDYDAKISYEAAMRMGRFALMKNLELDVPSLVVLIKFVDNPLSIRLINASAAKISRDDMILLLNTIGSGYANLAKLGRRLTLENNEDNLTLVQQLVKLGMASSYDTSSKHGGIRVNMRTKWV